MVRTDGLPPISRLVSYVSEKCREIRPETEQTTEQVAKPTRMTNRVGFSLPNKKTRQMNRNFSSYKNKQLPSAKVYLTNTILIDNCYNLLPKPLNMR